MSCAVIRSSVAGPTHAAFEHVPHAELLADNAKILVLTLERETLRAGRDL